MPKVMQDQRSTGLEGLVVAAETDRIQAMKSDEFSVKNKGNPSHFFTFNVFALFCQAYAKWSQNQGPEARKSIPEAPKSTPEG